MKKINILLFSLLTIFSFSCSNTDDEKTEKTVEIPSSTTSKKVETEVSTEVQQKVQNYIKENDIFSQVPFEKPDQYEADLTGDGFPVFLTGDGFPVFLTGDGFPVFGVKQNKDTYFWNRNPLNLAFDYLQVTNVNNESIGVTNYARYSQIINYEINTSKPIENNRKDALIKTMSFGLTDFDGILKPTSVSAVTISPKNIINTPYSVRGVMFTTENKKFVFQSNFKLVDLPGVSLEENIGSNEISLFAEIIFTDNSNIKEEDFAVIATIKGEQFPLYKVIGNLYGNKVKLPELEQGKTEGLVIEAIDKLSLTSDGEYYGYTYILPLTK